MSTTESSALVGGKIPAKTSCPYKGECAFVEGCHHTGVLHPVPFSCATARGFDLVNLYKHERKQIAGNNS